VACRIARRAQIRSARRRKREVAADVDLPARDGSNLEASATDQAVHEEIRRLPESLRAPLVLCCLEGQSYDLAARRLGVREPTLRGRLHRARKTLESRLRRRGILAPTVAALLDPASLPLCPLPSSLIESTTQFAVRWSTLRGLLVGAGAVPETIAALAKGVIQAMFIQTVKVCGIATALTLGVVGTFVVAQQEKKGATVPAQEAKVASPPDEKAAATPAPSFDSRPKEEEQRIDLEQRTQQILQKLDENIDLKLPNPELGVELATLLKAVKQATTDEKFTGIPIYVDPLGLQEAVVSMGSPVSVYRSGHLGFILRESLRQLRLSFIVKDGFLMISSREDTNQKRLEDLDRKVDRLMKAMERVERAKGREASNGPKP
jgi:transposase-like protein